MKQSSLVFVGHFELQQFFLRIGIVKKSVTLITPATFFLRSYMSPLQQLHLIIITRRNYNNLLVNTANRF